MTLAQLNELNTADRSAALTRCCGAAAWVKKMNAIFPVFSEAVLLEQAATNWNQCSRQDWLEAFTHHPKIGGMDALKEKYAATSAWAAGEQSAVQTASGATLRALVNGNAAYEEKFGYIFIVCATGKSAAEMLELLEARLQHEPAQEIRVAMQEQGKITALRLQKLLMP